MEGDASDLTPDVMGCMSGRGAGVLAVRACPRLSAAASLAAGFGVTDDASLARVVDAAAAVSAGLDDQRAGFDPEQRAAAVGALAFFHRGGYAPTSAEIQQLKAVLGEHAVDSTSQAYRWSGHTGAGVGARAPA